MGTFQGHLLPGSLFVVFGVWWTSQIARRSLMCSMQSRSFYTSVTYPCPMHGRCVRWPLEAALKIVGTVIGIVAEVISALRFGTDHVLVGDIQHATMYSFFCLSGVIDVLTSYNKVPRGLDFLTNSLAFVAEGFLFSMHLHGQNGLNVIVHTVLLYVIAACAVTTLLELRFRHSILAALARAYFVLLQGTWFIQVGFILYNPIPGSKPWDPNSHENAILVSLIFVWHFMGVFLAMALICWLSKLFSRRMCRITTEDIAYEMVSSDEEVHVTGKRRSCDDSRFKIGDQEDSDAPYAQPLMERSV